MIDARKSDQPQSQPLRGVVPDEVLRHGEDVAKLSLRVADEIGLGAYERLVLAWGARIHDIGKARVPTGILEKPGPLTPAERGLIEQHPAWGVEMAPQSPIMVREIVLHHHERWDGSGYPEHLNGPNIPLLARIVAVCDVFDALVSDRPYRSAWSREDAVTYIEHASGREFDPSVVDAFMRVMNASA
ncbi:HD-GYP domain-containing protein [Deinococcus yavapaiensis]|uniref:Metal dependent phosphohydrolase n=1 Tax=Deinococcus yavapaiensis KR-236 TaxID=694435 RepID=A0A318SKK6_9DEIO|nr:HD-GYP domain-containing protein [Deinococcus yavapaiensis]PYE54889.1 metal dependent phosphohydrolase [Deinococcus yavapaiensis KR-236]